MSEFGPKFDRLERTWENQEPLEEHDCAEDGHVWRLIRTEPGDRRIVGGVETFEELSLHRCIKCGKEEIQ